MGRLPFAYEVGLPAKYITVSWRHKVEKKVKQLSRVVFEVYVLNDREAEVWKQFFRALVILRDLHNYVITWLYI